MIPIIFKYNNQKCEGILKQVSLKNAFRFHLFLDGCYAGELSFTEQSIFNGNEPGLNLLADDFGKAVIAWKLEHGGKYVSYNRVW